MAATNSTENNYNHTNRFMKALLDTLATWLKNLGEQLEFYGETSAQRELGKWLAKNGGSVYRVKGGCANELGLKLTELGIPFVADVNNPEVFILRQPDLERVMEANRDILVSRCNYFQEADAAEMEDAIARSGEIRDKTVFTIQGLNVYQTEVLKNKFNDVSKGFMVGIASAPGQGNHDVAVHGSKVYSISSKQKDLCKAYLEMSLSLYGYNSAKKIEQIDADRKFNRNLSEMVTSGRNFYVIGVDDPNTYIEINNNGFEVYQAYIDDKGMLQQQVTRRCNIEDIDYDLELQTYMDKLQNKAILESPQELFEHIATPVRNKSSDRPDKTEPEEWISKGESRMADKIDEMIKWQLTKDQIKKMSPQELFDFYQNEAMDIIIAAANNEVAAGYRETDFSQLASICGKYGINMQEYRNSLEPLENYKTEEHKAKTINLANKREKRQGYNRER